MRIRAPLDLGLAIRTRRRELGLSQAALASRAGVGRQWLVGVEQGKSSAELGLVLRTLGSLDLSLAVAEAVPSDRAVAVDIDAVVAAAGAQGRR
ncbi:MAG TPA: helix-turn-helix domain-containing protein [Vineibacter sp.]|nr:helix-turn-helix domain-containing protein [Vineibacter sp.]